MRPIKFRAWNKVKNIMCYENEDNDADYWDGVKASVLEVLNAQFDIEKYEFMQYTGLKDKHGKEIYEGDLIRCSETTYGYKDFEVNIPNIFEIKGYYEREYGEEWNNGEIFEIVGNIYENPELK